MFPDASTISGGSDNSFNTGLSENGNGGSGGLLTAGAGLPLVVGDANGGNGGSGNSHNGNGITGGNTGNGGNGGSVTATGSLNGGNGGEQQQWPCTADKLWQWWERW